MSQTIAIYHKDCVDGTTSAAVLLKKFPGAKTFPLGHGFEEHELTPILDEAEPGDEIYTVDCGLGAKEFLAKGYKVTILDHHAGAKEEFSALAAENKHLTFIFDNDKSGASLAWAHFFPENPVPEVIKLVEDGDLWKQKYGSVTKDVTNYLFMLVNKPEEIISYFDGSLDDIKKLGSVITKYLELRIDHAVKSTEPVDVDINGHKVPFYNITGDKSAAGNLLAVERSKTVGLFSIDGQKLKISFRSLNEYAPSALDLAKALGGGGHRNASGASMSLEDFVKRISF
jgi:uncharacterized protein